MMIDAQILEALQEIADTTVAAGRLKAIGRTFIPPKDGIFWELVNIPNPSASYSMWGNEKHYVGIFRLILHWPHDDQGAIAPTLAAQAVAAQFYKGRTLQNGLISVKITDNPQISGPIVDGANSIYPVSVRYECFEQ